MPLEQHPIPQHISSYEFRLVGDMTLKQFGYLAGGVIVAMIFYGLPIPGFFKWPLVIFFGFLGFAFAFLPVQERPLSNWLIAFFKASFSPTFFTWKKGDRAPNILTQSPSGPQLTPTQASKNPFDQQEEDFFRNLVNLFRKTKKPSQPQLPIPRPTPVTPPQPKKAVVFPQRASKPRQPAVAAKTSLHLPIPEPPSIANILTGMVLDKNGEMIEGAILEIRNRKGIPVRALKTNKIGQFRIATPLENDTYEIETEKEGCQFDIIKITTQGKIIQPIEIRAK